MTMLLGRDSPLASGEILSSMTSYGIFTRFLLTALGYGVFRLVWAVLKSVLEWRRTWRQLENGNIPAGPSRWEVLSFAGRHDPHRLIAEWTEKYGPIFHFELFHLQAVNITEPTLAAEVLRRSDVFDKPEFGYNDVERAMSPFPGHRSLVSKSTDTMWRIIRKGVMPAFSTHNLKHSFPKVQAIQAQLVRVLHKLGSGSVFDVDDVMSRESLDVIGQVGFGKDMEAISGLGERRAGMSNMQAASSAAQEAEEYLNDPIRRFKFWRWDVWAGKQRFAAYHKVAIDLLAELKAQGAGVDPASIAGHLLRIKDPETGAPLPDEELVPQLAVMFFAGFETTGHTLSWALYLLSQHPEVELKVEAELAEHGLLASSGNPTPRPVQWDDVGKLIYLNAVIKETMRLYPAAAAGTSRVAPVDVVIGGKFLIPKGVIVALPLFSFMRSTANWDRPDDFIPERFLEKDAELARRLAPSSHANRNGPSDQSCHTDDGQRNPVAEKSDAALNDSGGEAEDTLLRDGRRAVKRFLPFSEGPRTCVGMSLAKVNMTATLATVLGHFTFRLADEMGGAEGVRKAERMALTLSSSKGMKMHCIPRVAHVATS